MFKRCKVVMLATNQKATNGLQPIQTLHKLIIPPTGAEADHITSIDGPITKITI